MEVGNSLRQLDEYLKKIGNSELDSEEKGNEIEIPTENGEGVDNHFEKKSNDSVTCVKKSNDLNVENHVELSSNATDVSQKSNIFIGNFTPNNHNSIDTCDLSVTNVNLNNAHLNEDYFIGDEITVHRIPESIIEPVNIADVKTEAIHLEESEKAIEELAEVGLSYLSLEELASSRSQSSIIPQKANFDDTVSNTEVRPVSLRKSIANLEETVVPKPPKGRVTTLFDLSSIGELKRLWAKSDKPAKKSITQTTKNQIDSKGTSSLSVKTLEKSDNKDNSFRSILKQSAFVVDEIVSQETVQFEHDEEFERSSFKDITTKQCSVNLVRLEHQPMPANLYIDLTIPSKKVLKNGFGSKLKQSSVSKKIKKNVKTVVADSLTRISSKIKQSKVSKNILPKNKVLIPKPRAKSLKPSNTGLNETCVNVKLETDSVEMISEGGHETGIGNLCYENDSDDDYVPSDDYNDDDYSPKKKFKKTKSKQNYSLKSNGSMNNQKGTRIGKPPVFGHFECKHCDFTANEKNLVDKHHYQYHRVAITCEFCDKKFKSLNGILEHKAYKHDGGKPFICEYEGCTYASKNPVDLQRHKAKHETELKHVCDLCGWRTKWRRNLKHHYVMKHCDERKFKCTVCEFAAKRQGDLKEHMYRHTDEKPIECMVCGFRVKTNFELRSHMLVHSNEKPFKCTFPGCSGAAKTKSDLTKHMRVHQTERPCKCHICLKCYKNQHALNKHISGIHVADRKYKCDDCGRSFKNRFSLRKHMYIHAGYKPHECPICQWKFSSRSNMEKHMVTHDTNERPYPCPLCPHASKHPDHLLTHIGSMHGDKYAYFCELCKKPFKRYWQLKVHYERMHSDQEVKMLKTSPVDLALLKIEMKLELDEKGAGKRKNKGRCNNRALSDAVIKEEPVDTGYGDVANGEEDISDVRLDENTGQVEIVRKKTNRGLLDEVNKNPTLHMETGSGDTRLEKIDEHKLDVTNTNADSSEAILVGESSSDGLAIGASNENARERNQEEETLATVEQEYDSEISEKKMDEVVISKDELYTVVQYNDLRLPLATKGFKFNYEKTGKKPKAWFMDMSFMDTQTAERHKKYKRRLGLLPPIPRGHPSKGYKKLKHFVDERKRRLKETVKKAKFTKDVEISEKRKLSRNKRFKGKYTEFETVDGEALTVSQVQELLPKLEDLKEEKIKPIKRTPGKTSTSKFSQNTTKKSKVNSREAKIQRKATATKKTIKKKTVKQNNNKIKVSVKNNSTKNSKNSRLLLTSEEKKVNGSKSEKLKIRKPKFIEKTKAENSEDDSVDRNSFQALEKILSECNNDGKSSQEKTSVSKPSTAKQTKTKAKSKAKCAKVKTQKSKTGRKPKSKEQKKTKYNKKYVPVKMPLKRKKREDDNMSSTGKKRLKLTPVTHQKSSDGNGVGVIDPVNEGVYGPNVYIPVQDSQLVVVYPTCVVQNSNMPDSLENNVGHVMLNDNSAYVNDVEAPSVERLDMKRNLNEMIMDSFNSDVGNSSGHNSSGDFGQELMPQNFTEAVVVKQEPVTDDSYYITLAQQSESL